MATFSSFAEFGAELDKMAKSIDNATKLIARAMAERAQSIAQASAAADLGGDLKFTHWAPTAETKIKTIPNGAVLMPTKSGAGVWTVANQGRHNTSGGFSGPGINVKTGLTKKLKSGKVGKVKSFKGGKRWNGTTQGMDTADKAVAKMEAELPTIATKGIRVVMAHHFDVD